MNAVRSADKEGYNYSIAVMKIIASFFVITAHFWGGAWSGEDSLSARILIFLSDGAVPVFVIISFYLTLSIFAEHDKVRLGKRAFRLMYPYFVWPVLCFAGVKLLYTIFNIEHQFGFRDLLWQLALGTDTYICPQMWYQLDILLLSLIIFVIFIALKNESYVVLAIMAVVALVVQYLGINKMIFGGLSHEAGFAMGELLEIFPIAVCGLFISKTKIVDRISNYRTLWFVFWILVDILVFVGGFPGCDGFSYSGTKVVIHAVSVFFAFNLLPFQNIPERIKKIIKFGARYSFGVYCMHFTVGILMNNILCKFELPANTLIECFLIYFISIFASALLGLVPSKYVRRLVE